MRINIPSCFVEHISIYRQRDYMYSFSFAAIVKNYGDKQMRIRQEPTTACEIILIF